MTDTNHETTTPPIIQQEQILHSNSGQFQPKNLPELNLDDVSIHSVPFDCWIVVYDRVYDVTEFLLSGEHPGGFEIILEYAGRDATFAFRGVGHSKLAERMLEPYLIGILPVEERIWDGGILMQ